MGEGEHIFVKICGITRLSDARAAIRAGANALGFVFSTSPRRISPSAARRITAHVHPALRKIGVFVDSPPDRVLAVVQNSGIDGVQLQGSEPPEWIAQLKREDPALFVAKVLKVTGPETVKEAEEFSADVIFLDRKDPLRPELPSTAIPPEWIIDAGLDRFVLAGGLDPVNVGPLIREVRPWGVDVSSGVEAAPGQKDPVKIRAFVSAVREAERTL